MSPSLQTNSLNKLRVEIRKEEPLKNHCTLKIGGSALCLAFPQTLDELKEVLAFAKVLPPTCLVYREVTSGRIRSVVWYRQF